MTRNGILKNEFLIVLVVIALLAALAVALTLRSQITSAAVKNAASGAGDESAQGEPKSEPQVMTTPSGLKYIDLKVGTGEKAKPGSKVHVIYTGTFQNGEKFDSNVGSNPYEVIIGKTSVIQGWHEGLTGMQLGGKRKLTIPSKLAYGENGRSGIPPNTDLLFEVELVKSVTP